MVCPQFLTYIASLTQYKLNRLCSFYITLCKSVQSFSGFARATLHSTLQQTAILPTAAESVVHQGLYKD